MRDPTRRGSALADRPSEIIATDEATTIEANLHRLSATCPLACSPSCSYRCPTTITYTIEMKR
jgi:hypothetical protein